MRILFVCFALLAGLSAAEPPSRLGERGVVAVRDLRGVGDATALAAVESFVHTAAHGPATALPAMCRWSWRREAHRHFRDLPAALQERFASPENLVAEANVAAFAQVERVQVIARVVVSELEEIIGVRAFGPDGRVTEHLFWLRWTSGTWLRVELAGTVARVGRQLASGQRLDATDPASFREQYEWLVPQTGPKPALDSPP